MNHDKKNKSNIGEEVSCKFLQQKKYRIIQRNYHSMYGEIDIIAIHNNILIFIEVKLRSASLENAINSVSRNKQRKLILTAADFLSKNPVFEDMQTRFDVIALNPFNDSSYKIKHIENAFLSSDINEF